VSGDATGGEGDIAPKDWRLTLALGVVEPVESERAAWFPAWFPKEVVGARPRFLISRL
jgi:hypothetical protein